MLCTKEILSEDRPWRISYSLHPLQIIAKNGFEPFFLDFDNRLKESNWHK